MSGSRSSESAADRLQIALDLYDDGEAMMRQNLRRRFPRATEAEIEARLTEWVQTRPGAEDGDADGRPVPLPQPR
jgi:hypothetical protein